MKNTSKRLLAALLALLMLFGIAGAASADSGDKLTDSITVVTPEDGVFPSSDGWRVDLRGSVFTVKGPAFPNGIEVSYDEVTSDSYQSAIYPDKINWGFYAESYGGEAYLEIYASQFTHFVVQYVADDGTEYGYYNSEEIFYATTEISVSNLPNSGNLDFSTAVPVTLDTTVDVQLVYDSLQNPISALYAFTPAEDGYYKIASDGARSSENYYTREGEWIYFAGVDPWVAVYDSGENQIAYNDDDYSSLNFRLIRFFEGGETYYIEASAYSNGSTLAPYTFTITSTESQQLKVRTTSVKLDYHGVLDLNWLLEGTTWALEDLYIGINTYNSGIFLDKLLGQYNGSVLVSGWDCNHDYQKLYAQNRGTASIYIEAPDGVAYQVKVEVKYSVVQWLCTIFLGGFVWMKYTLYGPFDLFANIRELQNYGVRNAISDLLSEWF
ncbi:MAG: hypothetical protein LBT21_02200 [Oscillospiraceae bacterium]|jgi:hypothetical protein|nr:hypothetical protein [Oscillospiraceae bacterium]